MLTIQRPQTRRVSLDVVSRPVAPPAPEPLVEHGTRRALVVGGVMLAALLQMIDMTIVNVSLPTIQGNLGATIDEATWVITAYVVANIVVIPITPWMQRRFGRKNYFLASIAGFTAASVLCGMANSLDSLIVFRIVQGAFGGGLLSTAQMILRDTFGPKELGLSQSIFAFATIIGPSVGPTLGGIITDNMSWPWIFDVNILPGILAATLLWLYLRDNAKPVREPIDAPGPALLVVTIGALQYVLDQGQQYDWFSDRRITLCTIVALAGGAAFVWWELTTRSPIVDLRVLRHRAVAVACLTIIANAVGIFGGALLLPQFTVTQLGFTETQAGMLMGLRALPLVFLTFPIGRLTNNPQIDLRWLIGGGLFVHGIGAIWLAHQMTAQSDFLSLAGPQLFTGVGIAFIYSPLLVATLRAVPREGPKASALVILAFQLGGSAAAAAVVTMADRREQFHQSILAGSATLQRPDVASFMRTHAHPVAQLAQMIASQSTILAYADALFAAGAFVVCFSPFVVFLKQQRQRS
ncbi:MAG TPA: DHA2 family efflux MFS transporter permease subunit [Candidatus Baltobacteraceae bacterium]|nr:DHA2 family efflux MFS transporter permease subunit [Candidatus Baltobacteraceae bacterium]